MILFGSFPLYLVRIHFKRCKMNEISRFHALFMHSSYNSFKDHGDYDKCTKQPKRRPWNVHQPFSSNSNRQLNWIVQKSHNLSPKKCSHPILLDKNIFTSKRVTQSIVRRPNTLFCACLWINKRKQTTHTLRGAFIQY